MPTGVSIACNIVEGCARHTEADFLRFLGIAYGSACELEYQVSLAFCLGYIDINTNKELAGACEETSKVLNGLIRSVRQQWASRLQTPASRLFCATDSGLQTPD